MSWVIMNWQKLSMTILHGGWTSVGTTTTMLESESILHREPIFHPMRMSPIDIPCLCTISKLGNGMTIYGKLITPQHPDYLRALTQSRGTCTMGQFVDMPLYTNTACAFTVSIWEEGKSVWRIPKNRQLTPHILLWTRHLYSPRQIVPFGQYWTYTNWPDYTVVSVIIPMERLQAWLQVINTHLAAGRVVIVRGWRPSVTTTWDAASISKFKGSTHQLIEYQGMHPVFISSSTA